jgi:pyruvate-ferredoxin/flavodoxin oxidoreductase
LTPAEFALGEVRFKKQFRRLAPDEEERAIPMHEYVELPRPQRGDRIPFVYATDDDRLLIKVACAEGIVSLVEDRRRYWQTLQYLSGVHEAQLTALHRSDFDELRTLYDQAMQQRESSLDDIARAMSELATSSKAPVGLGFGGGSMGAGAAPAVAPAATAVSVADGPVWLDPADILLCNDCGTCYQELPQFFEKTTMIIDGEVRQVAQMIPGAASTVEMTPEIEKRIARVRKTCDAEIIR